MNGESLGFIELFVNGNERLHYDSKGQRITLQNYTQQRSADFISVDVGVTCSGDISLTGTGLHSPTDDPASMVLGDTAVLPVMDGLLHITGRERHEVEAIVAQHF